MIWFQNIYVYFQTIFEILTFRGNSIYDMIDNNDEDYEIINFK